MSLSYLQRCEMAVDYLVIQFQIDAPKESWNLTRNGIRKVWDPETFNWAIAIGGENAPYAPYTNEPWIADKWINKETGVMAVNPNLYWIQRCVEKNRQVLVMYLSGEISQEDFNEMVATATNTLSEMSIKAGEMYS